MEFEVSNGESLVMFDRDGIQVKELREPIFGDGKPELVQIESHDWDDLPTGNLAMEVVDIEPELSDDANTGLKSLTFKVNNLEQGSPEVSENTTFWNELEAKTGIEYDDGDIIFARGKNGKENLIDFMKFLYDTEYLTEEDVPRESGHTRYLLNSEPKHQEGDEMSAPAQIAPNIYVETHRSNPTKKKIMLELGDEMMDR